MCVGGLTHPGSLRTARHQPGVAERHQPCLAGTAQGHGSSWAARQAQPHQMVTHVTACLCLAMNPASSWWVSGPHHSTWRGTWAPHMGVQRGVRVLPWPGSAWLGGLPTKRGGWQRLEKTELNMGPQIHPFAGSSHPRAPKCPDHPACQAPEGQSRALGSCPRGHSAQRGRAVTCSRPAPSRGACLHTSSICLCEAGG